MAQIALEGMRFHGFHGVYPAEQLIGAEYILDVFIQTDISPAAKTDELALTINYESVYQICRLEMEENRHNLIETIIKNIAERLKNQFAGMMSLKIKVKKLNPPLGGRVECASIEDEEVYVKLCPRCKKPMICYNDKTCWCNAITIHQATRESLEKQFNGCLCQKCLAFYAN